MSPRKGFNTKTNRLTDRQSYINFDIDFKGFWSGYYHAPLVFTIIFMSLI
jgi:hypothetical protein